MESSVLTIRNTIRAVIIQDGYFLLQKKQDPLKGVRYSLPGGAQLVGESIMQALQRSVRKNL